MKPAYQRRTRRWARWLAPPLAVLGFGLVIAAPQPVRVHATVNGQPVAVGQPARVGRLIDAAGGRIRDGRLRSAVTGSVLDAHGDPAVITLNGVPAGTEALVHEGDAVRTTDGHDWIEAGVARTVSVPFGGLPDVETHAWRPGLDGTRRVVEGARSREVVRRTVITPALTAEAIPGRVVTLSFDDGPNADWTPQVLDILRRKHVHAVFCVIGDMVDVHPELVARVFAEGHRLCDHSVTHAELTDASTDQLVAEIGPTADRVEAITGERPAFFRSPYGVFTDPVIDAAHEQGLRVLGWGVDTEDFDRPAPTVLVPAIVAAVTPGSVILFHDGGGNRQLTVDALPFVITALRRQGYRFVLPAVTRTSSARSV